MSQFVIGQKVTVHFRNIAENRPVQVHGVVVGRATFEMVPRAGRGPIPTMWVPVVTLRQANPDGANAGTWYLRRNIENETFVTPRVDSTKVLPESLRLEGTDPLYIPGLDIAGDEDGYALLDTAKHAINLSVANLIQMAADSIDLLQQNSGPRASESHEPTMLPLRPVPGLTAAAAKKAKDAEAIEATIAKTPDIQPDAAASTQ